MPQNQNGRLQWSKEVKKLFEFYHADRVVGEVNQGGDLIAMALHNIAPELPFKAVRALRGKYLRAEPVAALYEANRVHHANCFAELEEEMCSFRPKSGKSPDRMDALAWALTELMSSNSNSESRMIMA